MFDMLQGLLVAVVVVAVIIMVIGMANLARIRLAMIFGWWLIAMAVVVVMREGLTWYEKGEWEVIPAGQIWYEIDRESLLLIQPAIERYLFTKLWDLLAAILQFPAWGVLGMLGFALLLLDHYQLQRMKPGERPPSLWSKIWKQLRGVEETSEEA